MNTVNILAWQKILLPHFVSIAWSFLIFSRHGGLVHHYWSVFKHNSIFALMPLRPIKVTAFIAESVEKSKSFPAHTGVWVLNSKEKTVWTKIFHFFVIIRFSCRWISSNVFKEAILFSFAFQYVIYVHVFYFISNSIFGLKVELLMRFLAFNLKVAYELLSIIFWLWDK